MPTVPFQSSNELYLYDGHPTCYLFRTELIGAASSTPANWHRHLDFRKELNINIKQKL